MEKQDNKQDNQDKHSTAQRVIALAGVVLLGALIIATFVVAILNKPELKNVFNVLFVLDFVVPVMLWMYIYLYKRARKTDEQMEELAQKELEEERIREKLRKQKEDGENREQK